MTQFEYVVWQFIKKNPQCTTDDILASFARAPQVELLFSTLKDLEMQKLISKAGQLTSEKKAAIRYSPILAY